MADKDVLLELQQAIKSRQSVVFLNGGEPCATLSAATHLRLSNDTVIPKSSPTRIRRAANDITDWKAHPEAFYSAGAIYIAWVSKDASVADYLKQAREAGLVAFVSVTDRKFVVDWLEGRIQEHDRIVPLAGKLLDCEHEMTFVLIQRFTGEAGPQTPQRTNISLPDSSPSRGANVTATKTPEKRSYIPDAQDVQVVKKIKLGEIELRDSRTVLRGSKLNVAQFNTRGLILRLTNCGYRTFRL
jgi:parafibromin